MQDNGYCVYLINQQDRWCSENNNGDHVVAAFLTEKEAVDYVNELNDKQEENIYYVIIQPLGPNPLLGHNMDPYWMLNDLDDFEDDNEEI